MGRRGQGRRRRRRLAAGPGGPPNRTSHGANQSSSTCTTGPRGRPRRRPARPWTGRRLRMPPRATPATSRTPPATGSASSGAPAPAPWSGPANFNFANDKVVKAAAPAPKTPPKWPGPKAALCAAAGSDGAAHCAAASSDGGPVGTKAKALPAAVKHWQPIPKPSPGKPSKKAAPPRFSVFPKNQGKVYLNFEL